MNRCPAVFLLVCVGCWFATEPAAAITIATVHVGNLNNASDPADGDAETAGIQNFGSVPYGYNIGTNDVTVSQYVAFLNAKDATSNWPRAVQHQHERRHVWRRHLHRRGHANGSKYSAKAGRENHPVNNVNWFEAVRFANWLHNGQGNGDTESGGDTSCYGAPAHTDQRRDHYPAIWRDRVSAHGKRVVQSCVLQPRNRFVFSVSDR